MTTTKFRPEAALAAAALLSALLFPPVLALADLPAPVFDRFVVSKGTYEDKVVLSWHEPQESTGIGEYEVLRYTQDPMIPPTSLVGNAFTNTTFEDTTAVPGVLYKYIVSTWNTEYTSGETPFAFGWAGKAAAPAKTFPVTDLEATQGTLTDRVRLTWTAPDFAETFTVVRLRDHGGVVGYETLADSLASPGFDDTTAEPGVHYDYRVDAIDFWGRKAPSSLVTGWASALPAAPVMVSASSNRTDGILVVWKAGTGGGATESYNLWRYHWGYPNSHMEIASGLTKTEYLDDDSLVCGDIYSYRAVACNAYGATTNDSPVEGMKLPEMAVVQDFTASRGEYPDRVWLYWTTTNATSIKSWRIVRFAADADIMGYEVLTNSTMVEPGFLDTTATPDMRYRYQLLLTDIWGRESLAGTAWGWALRVPDNDSFRDARPISAKSGTDASTNSCASFEVSEPYPAGVSSATRTVWWNYAAPFDGVVRFDTDGSHFLTHYGEEDEWPEIGILTALGVYTGDAVTKLDAIGSPIPCVDSQGETYYDQGGKIFEASSGTVYRVQASGYGQYFYDETLQRWDDQWGLIRLNWRYTHYRVAFDPNGGTVSTNAVMVPVGQKLGDAMATFPVPVREGYRFVDWKFENNASVSASAAFAITESHTFTAEWAYISPNDDFEDALRLNVPGQTRGFSEMPNTNSTLQTGEPLLAAYPNATHTLWWSWIAAEDCTVRFSTTNSVDTQGNEIDTVLGVYTGSALGSLAQVVTGDDGIDESGFIDDIGTFWSFVEFEAKKGTVYHICVGVNDKYNRQVVEGTIRLNWGLVTDGVSSGGYALLPPGSSGVDIPAALGELADPSLEALIGGNVDAYNDFAEWANEMGAEDVRASAHAAASYQLGTTELLQNDPEIAIEGVDVVPSGGATTGGTTASRPKSPATPVSLTLVVTVRDGGEPVEVTAATVAALVEATRDVCDWESPEAKLDPHVEAVTSGSDTIVTIVATPGDGTVPQAFLRIAP